MPILRLKLDSIVIKKHLKFDNEEKVLLFSGKQKLRIDDVEKEYSCDVDMYFTNRIQENDIGIDKITETDENVITAHIYEDISEFSKYNLFLQGDYNFQLFVNFDKIDNECDIISYSFIKYIHNPMV